ncbi:MAG: hypothetical protein HY718_13560 [Planctomycetes bacterium]|nr:hypothetical protein [Planctomycetota bacterium]
MSRGGYDMPPAGGCRSNVVAVLDGVAACDVRPEHMLHPTMFAGNQVRRLREQLHRVIVGQDDLLHKMLVGLLGNGHILIEGVPGLAKTTAVSSWPTTSPSARATARASSRSSRSSSTRASSSTSSSAGPSGS